MDEELEEPTTSSKSSEVTDDSVHMSQDQTERVRKNKQRALELRKARNRAKPYTKPCTSSANSAITNVKHDDSSQSLRDSHAGFIFEEEPVKRGAVCRVTEESGE